MVLLSGSYRFLKSRFFLCKVIVLIFCFFCFVSNAKAATYFVDNTLTTGANDGSSWPNAFHTIADLISNLNVASSDTIYIKATGVPIREFLGPQELSNKTIYGDAVGGTGTETTRGTTKSEFWGSIDSTSFTWTQEESSNVYRTENVNLGQTGYQSAYNTNALPIAWYYTSPTAITNIIGSGASCPSPVTSLALNKACYNSTTKQFWINIGANPTGSHIEIVNLTRALEITTDTRLYGVVGKHAAYGIANGGCSNWIIENVELLYNQVGASVNASDLDTSSYFRKNSIHNNASYGLYVSDVVKNTHYQNNLIYSNGGNGVYLRSGNETTDPGQMGYLENNTIYGNTTYGIYIRGGVFYDYTNWTVKNNIVLGHATNQLFKYNDTIVNLTASNNAPGATNAYNSYWSAVKGTGNVETDPLLVSSSDFRLQASSPAINAGADVGITSDYLGTAVPRGAAPDIGAYEYDITAPTLSGGSSIGQASTNNPNFTFTSDEAGTISYLGDCSSATTSAIAGSNTITFSSLFDGIHSNCKVIVTDPAGNISAQLDVASFTSTTPSRRGSVSQTYTYIPASPVDTSNDNSKANSTDSDTKETTDPSLVVSEKEAMIISIQQKIVSLINQLIQMLIEQAKK